LFGAFIGDLLQPLLIRNLGDAPREIRHRLGQQQSAQIVAEPLVLVRAADAIRLGVDARRIDAAVDTSPESVGDLERLFDDEMHHVVRQGVAVRRKRPRRFRAVSAAHVNAIRRAGGANEADAHLVSMRR